MDKKKRINKLITEFEFNEETAFAHIESEGKCMYCGDDLYEFRQGYSSSQIDHLLPSSKYEELRWNLNNLVFSCSSCNGLKHKLDVLKNGENPVEEIENNREKLILRVREILSEKISERNLEYEAVKKIVRNE